MKNKFLLVFTALLFTFLFWSFGSVVFALTISPPVMELEGNPGRVTPGAIRIFNETEKTVSFYVSVTGFTAKPGEKGEPLFFEPTDKVDLPSWIEIDKGPIEVGPKEWKEVQFSIRVPEWANPGGHYAAIFLSTEPGIAKPGEATIGIRGMVGTLVLLSIPGEVKEQGRLIEFSLVEEKRVFEHLPIKFRVRVENQGTVHIKPAGIIEIRNIFGRKVGEAKVNIAKMPDGKERAVGNVLPNSIRMFESVWQKKKSSQEFNPPKTFFEKVKFEKENFAFGRYQAKLNLVYGAKKDKNLTAVVNFWVFPWHLILVSLALVIVLILLIVFGVRKYNQWIIKKAMNSKMSPRWN